MLNHQILQCDVDEVVMRHLPTLSRFYSYSRTNHQMFFPVAIRECLQMVYSDDVASPSSPSALFFLMTSFVFITEEEDVASNPRVVVLLSHLRFLFASLQPQQCYPLVRYALLFLILYLQEKTRLPFRDEPIEWNEDAPRRPSVLAALEEKSDKPEPAKPFRSYYDKDGDAR